MKPHRIRRNIKRPRLGPDEPEDADWIDSEEEISSDGSDSGSDLEGFVVSDNFVEYSTKYALESEIDSDSDNDPEYKPLGHINIYNTDAPDKVKEWCQFQLKYNDHDSKMKSKVQFVLSYPWDKLTMMPINLQSPKKDVKAFWQNVHTLISNNVSYMKPACEQLIHSVARAIAKPSSKKKPILIYGPPGCAKSRIVTKVFGPVLGVPTISINVGNWTREDFAGLKGSDGVYEGSGPSKLLQAIHQAGVSNPVIVFDEFDKIRDHNGYHFFNQLFDDTSVIFKDQFFDGMPFDISQVEFVCIANSIELIPDPLMTRFKKKIYTSAPTNEQKVQICLKHNVPEILGSLGFSSSEIVFSQNSIKYIIEKLNIRDSEGMRSLIHGVESIGEKINTIRVQQGSNIFDQSWFFSVNFPLKVDKNIIDRLLD